MKRILWFVLAASAVFGHAARASPEESLSGRWQGVLTKGMMNNVVQLEISRKGSGYQGLYWGSAPVGTPIAITQIGNNPGVHFRVGTVGEFEGSQHGDKIEGTFTDGQGSGSFTFEKRPQWDDVMNAP